MWFPILLIVLPLWWQGTEENSGCGGVLFTMSSAFLLFLAIAGYTMQSYYTESVQAIAINFSDDFVRFNNLAAGATLWPF